MSTRAVFHSIVVGCDHAAFEMKQKILEFLPVAFPSLQIKDVGCFSPERVDYPDIAHALCSEIQEDNFEGGILICGTGIGMSIAANKHEGIRCGLVHSPYTAEMIREHNNANVLAFGGRTNSFDEARVYVEKFITTDFGSGRHGHRVDKFRLYPKGGD